MAGRSAKYPPEVLTRSQRGEAEVRNLLSRGSFVKYDYRDPETGKRMENGKFSIILKSGDKEEHCLLIPVKSGRFLAIVSKEEKTARKFWDQEKGDAVSLE